MLKFTKAAVSGLSPPPSSNSRLHNDLVLAAAYVLVYVGLDWVSSLYSWHSLGITDWNPASALSLALLLGGGLRFAPARFVAALSGELAADPAVNSMPVKLLLALVLCSGYSISAWLLLRVFKIDPRLSRRSDVAYLTAVVFSGAFVMGPIYVGIRAAAGLLPWDTFPRAVSEHWFAEAIGILAIAPLLLVLTGAEARARLREIVRSREFALQMLTVVAILWITCVVRQYDQFKHRYLLFLPLVWMAARSGLIGATLGTFAILLGLLSFTQLTSPWIAPIVSLHWMVLALVLTGLLLGITVDESERALAELSRSLRLAAAAETAAALAHELNQPLTALANYGKACQLMLRMDSDRQRELGSTIDKIVHEATRAGAVVHRLRDFLRSGATRLAPVPASHLLQSVLESFEDRARAKSIEVSTRVNPALKQVFVDSTQIEIVLWNLLANAHDSIVAAEPQRRNVEVEADSDGPGYVRISVRDSGPGIKPDLGPRVFDAFASSKQDGMGLGLTLSRAIIEAHGGRLWAETSAGGVFHFTLPVLGHDDSDSNSG